MPAREEAAAIDLTGDDEPAPAPSERRTESQREPASHAEPAVERDSEVEAQREPESHNQRPRETARQAAPHAAQREGEAERGSQRETASRAKPVGGVICLSSVSFAVAGALRVPESATPRHKALLTRRAALAAKELKGTLSLQDVADYETYVQELVKGMESETVQLSRSFKLVEAKVKMARDPRRADALNDEFEKLRLRCVPHCLAPLPLTDS